MLLLIQNRINMKNLLFKLLLVFIIPLSAQNIPLKGNLGVRLSQAPENSYNAVYAIAEVFPNTTAQNLMLQANDILVKINGVLIDTPAKVPTVIGKFLAGNSVTATVLRNGTLVQKKGKVMARTAFKKANHELKLLEIPFRNGYNRGYLTYPKGKGPFPTIYYIQGYPCQSIDAQAQHPIMQFTSAMVDLGYAVFRIEKPGAGEHANLKPCVEYSYDDELENFQIGYQYLENVAEVDRDNIYLFGHSLGGNVAPILAQKTTPAGVVVFGTLTKPWEDYMLDMAHYTQTHFQDATEVASQIPTLKSAVDKLYVQQVSHDKLTTKEKELLRNWHNYTDDGLIFTRQVEFWQGWNRYDYVNEWAKVKIPVLAMYGEHDVHAIGSLDTELIARIVNQNNTGNGTYKLVKDTNHLFAKVASKEAEMNHIQNGTSGQVAFTKFNPQLPLDVHAWILSQKNKDKNLVYEEVIPFPKSATNMSSMDAVVADFTGDGHDDLMIATEFGPNRLFVYENGAFTLGKHYPN